MKFRKGDKVSAVGVVQFAYPDDEIGVQFYPHASNVYLKPEALTLVERKFEPGEMVVVNDDHERVWEVVAADGGMLWLKRGDATDGSRLSVSASICELVADVDDGTAPLPPSDEDLIVIKNAAPRPTYTVKPGDTLGVIALVQGVDRDALSILNGFDVVDPHLEAGQVLELPR